MSRLIHERFLLHSDEAVRLYHDYAAGQPIIDYHTHLPPAEIAADRRWENISQVWLNGDHYKWRQMRANGIAERFCTGDATDREKFDAFAGIVPYLLRNPLYHWCHLELARYFQIDDTLLSAKDDLLSPIKAFMHGPQRIAYDESMAFVHDEEANFAEVPAAEVQPLRDLAASVHPYRGGAVPAAKAATAKVRGLLAEMLQAERDLALATLDAQEIRLQGVGDFAALDEPAR